LGLVTVSLDQCSSAAPAPAEAENTFPTPSSMVRSCERWRYSSSAKGRLSVWTLGAKRLGPGERDTHERVAWEGSRLCPIVCQCGSESTEIRSISYLRKAGLKPKGQLSCFITTLIRR
jgi:hypothetical protein